MTPMSARRRVESAEWERLLRALSLEPAVLFHEKSVDEGLVDRFLNPQGPPAEVFLGPSDSALFFYRDFQDSAGKDEALSAALFQLKRFSPPARKMGQIAMVLEELLLNATVSAARVASQDGSSMELRGRLRLEWDERDLWIHVSDSYGAFLRRNFERSFREPGDVAETQGHSGRGLRIIFDRVQDLWVRSRKGWGTVVSVRVDLSSVGDLQKSLLADFS